MMNQENTIPTISTISTDDNEGAEFIAELMDEFDDEETAEELAETSEINKSFNERTSSHLYDVYDYNKYAAEPKTKNPRKTGQCLRLNECDFLACVDIDNKGKNSTDKLIIYDEYIAPIKQAINDGLNVIVTRTAHDGLHIYCNYSEVDKLLITKNRNVGIYQNAKVSVDVFASVDKNSISGVMWEGSKLRESINKVSHIIKYTHVLGNESEPLNASLFEVLHLLDIKIQTENARNEEKQFKESEELSEKTDLTDELFEKLRDGFKGLTIHNDTGNHSINEEITLFVLFNAINAINDKQKADELYKYIYINADLTDNAREHYEQLRQRYELTSSSVYILYKILKIHNAKYYDEHIKPLLIPQIVVNKFDLNDKFSMIDLRKNAARRKYHNDSEFVADLSRVIAYIEDGDYYIKKVYNNKKRIAGIKYIHEAVIRSSLDKIEVYKNESNKIVTGWNICKKYTDKITFNNVYFNESDPEVFNIYHGLKYETDEIQPDENTEEMQRFLNFVHEVIANNRREISEYILKWLAYIVQHPGEKTETMIVIKGLEGTGKGTLGGILRELFCGYSEEVAKLDEITGQFNAVIENNIFIILNEIANVGENRFANYDTLKAVVTDKTIRINEKNQPRRTAENCANFMMFTNNFYPVKVTASDRRYVILRINGKYKNNFEYFDKLHKLENNKEFMQNLTMYLKTMNLDNFRPTNIPRTEERDDLIEVTRSPLDNWINDHYNELLKGMPCSEATNQRPPEYKEIQFQKQLKARCDRKRCSKLIDPSRPWIYVLNKDSVPLYHQTIDEDEWYDSDDEETNDEETNDEETNDEQTTA